jgi:hypothetical protein
MIAFAGEQADPRVEDQLSWLAERKEYWKACLIVNKNPRRLPSVFPSTSLGTLPPAADGHALFV